MTNDFMAGAPSVSGDDLPVTKQLFLCQTIHFFPTLLILGYSRFNFVRASSILNCQLTPRCLALVFCGQIPISDWSKGSSLTGRTHQTPPQLLREA